MRHTINNKQMFREFVEKGFALHNNDNADWVVVRNMEYFDYEQVRNYTLTITATVNINKFF